MPSFKKDFQVLKSFANTFKVSQDRKFHSKTQIQRVFKAKNPLRGSNDPRTDVPPMSQPPIGSDQEGTIVFTVIDLNPQYSNDVQVSAVDHSESTLAPK